MAELKKEAWAKLQAEYEAGVPVAALSRAYGVSRTAINKKAAKGGWAKGDAAKEVDERTLEVLHGTQGLPDATTRDGVLDDIAKQRAELILNHRREWKEVEAIGREVLACLEDANYRPKFWSDWKTTKWDYQKKDAQGNPTPLEQEYKPFDQDARDKRLRTLQNTYKTRAEALITKQEGERRAYGFDYKMQMDDQGKKDDGFEKRVEQAKDMLSRMEKLARSKPMPKPQQGDLPA